MKRRFGSLKIGTKIICGFLLVALIAGLIGITGIFALQITGDAYHVAYSDSVATQQNTERISSSFQKIRAALLQMALSPDRAGKNACADIITEQLAVIETNMGEYKAVMDTYSEEEVAKERMLFANLEAALLAFTTQQEIFVSDVGQRLARYQDAFEQLGAGSYLNTLSQNMDDSITTLLNYKSEYAANQIASTKNLALTCTLIMGGGIFAGVLIAILVGLTTARSMSKRIKVVVEAIENLSQGQLDVDITTKSRDEIGVLATSARSMSDMLKAIISDLTQGLSALAQGDFTQDSTAEDQYVGDYLPLLQSLRQTTSTLSSTLRSINMAAEQVSTGSDHVSSGAQALASGSTEQAASVQELSASVERIAEQAEENSATVAAAAGAVRQAGEGVSAGNLHMEQLTQAMIEIDSSSRKIVNITKVIEDIAFQTNILALNAAIEAARAGSAGKGFAVVADEVRTLAAKSGEAAKQTAQLIQTSVTSVAKGSEMTERTAEILKEVGAHTLQVTQSFGKIELSIEEQTDAIGQIKQGLAQISSVVQTNAATAEENSATSEEMSAQAATLRGEVGKFKLSEDANTAAAPVYSLPESFASMPEMLSDPALGLGKY